MSFINYQHIGKTNIELLGHVHLKHDISLEPLHAFTHTDTR